MNAEQGSVRSILAVSHEATRSGAPMIVLHFLRWLKAHTAIRAEVVILGDGPLREDFESVFPVHIVSPSKPLPRTVMRAAARCDVGYLNSLGSLDIADRLPASLPLVSHVHELAFNLRHGLTPNRLANLPRIARFVAAATSVKEELCGSYSIAADHVDVVYEFIPQPPMAQLGRTAARERLGLPQDAVIVGGVGSIEWRKGLDLLVELALELRQANHPEIRLLWIGGPTGEEPETRDVVTNDIAAAGLGDVVTLLPPRPDVVACLPALDAFVLLSREDPFPLVCIEAAASGLPIVCFERSGGMAEFVTNETGARVPYLDLAAMAAALVDLLADHGRHHQMAAAARHRAAEMSDVMLRAPDLLRTLQRVAS